MLMQIKKMWLSASRQFQINRVPGVKGDVEAFQGVFNLLVG